MNHLNMSVSEQVAEKLLAIEAVNLKPDQPYTWASGLKAPIYCENRLIMSFSETRDFIEQDLADLIKTQFEDVEVVAGTATAGITHTAFVDNILKLSLIYIKTSAKDHGKENAIEGYLKPGSKVVMVEDLISTGGSVLDAASKVEQAGGEVIGCAAIFNYMLESGQQAFSEVEYSLETLTNYRELVEYAVSDPKLKAYYDTLVEWYQDPAKWSKQFEA